MDLNNIQPPKPIVDAEVKMGSTVHGKFVAKNWETLRDELRVYHGDVFEFKAMFRMDEDEAYPGQWAWSAYKLNGVGALEGYWVPTEDIEPVVLIA